MNRVVGIERGGNHTGVDAAIGALPPRSPAHDAYEQRSPQVDEVGPIRRDMEGPLHDVADEYRTTMRDLAASVTIVTTRCGNEIHGMTASAVCCVSLAPPLLLVCIAKSTRTHRLIAEGGVFAVHLLHQAQRDLADRFAGRLVGCDERFKGLAYDHGMTGAPVLLDCLAFLDCRVSAAHDGGDHTIFLGSVEDVGRRESGRALIYLQGNYSSEFALITSSAECGAHDEGISV